MNQTAGQTQRNTFINKIKYGDESTLYPISPLDRLYRNNIKIQLGRMPATFFKKVYMGNQSPRCALSKINVHGNTTFTEDKFNAEILSKYVTAGAKINSK